MISTLLILLGLFIIAAPIGGHPWLKSILILLLMVVAALIGCGAVHLGTMCG